MISPNTPANLHMAICISEIPLLIYPEPLTFSAPQLVNIPHQLCFLCFSKAASQNYNLVPG